MKKVIPALLLFLAWPHAGLAGEPVVPSKIEAVTVFSNQALIHRQASVSAVRGRNEFWFEIEARSIDPDSVTAKVFGAGEVLSVQYKKVPVSAPPQEKIRRLEEKHVQLMRSRKKLLDLKQALKKQEAFLNAFIDFSRNQIPKEVVTQLPKPEEIARTLSFLGDNYNSLYEQGRTADAQVEDLEKEIRVIEEELAALRGADRRHLQVIEILFSSEKDQPVRIETRYLVRGAGWQPLYKVAVPSGLEDIDLTLFSRISQKTGEDWRQARLTVSTVIPLRGVSLPTLYSWTLDLPRPAAGAVGRERIAYRTKSASPMAQQEEVLADEAGTAPAEAGFVQARRSESPLSFEYTIPQPIDVESRDKETLLPLFTRKLAGEFYHFCVPARVPLTFLTARVRSERELIGGMLNVHFNGQYVGKTLLKNQRAGEAFELLLGADREVAVKREKIRDRMQETYFGKFQRDTVVRELAYKITVENRKRSGVQLKVLDRIPVSKTDRIEIQDVKLSPAPEEKNFLDREGVMQWEQRLGPGEKGEIGISFTVRYPKELVLDF